MPSNNLKKLKKELAKAAAEKRPDKRGVLIAAVIAKALRNINHNPVLVGGTAVAFYTQARYTTGDIDMLTPGDSRIADIMKELGFEQLGKDYTNKALKVYVEFPGSFLEEGERSTTILVDAFPLRIISLEDLIIDRLNHFKYFKSGIDGLNTMMLLEQQGLDRKEIEEKAKAQDLLDALDHIEIVRERAIRKRLSPQEASELLESFLHRKQPL